MNVFEQLEQETSDNGVDLFNRHFKSKNIKGLYIDNNIALSNNLKTIAEKACVLSEELGHHYTTTGNILDQSVVGNRKQELHARLWAYDKMIGLTGLIRAYEHGCRSRSEAAEYLQVTEEFLTDAIECYRSKYGTYKKIDNYLIIFEPNLIIGRMNG